MWRILRMLAEKTEKSHFCWLMSYWPLPLKNGAVRIRQLFILPNASRQITKMLSKAWTIFDRVLSQALNHTNTHTPTHTHEYVGYLLFVNGSKVRFSSQKVWTNGQIIVAFKTPTLDVPFRDDKICRGVEMTYTKRTIIIFIQQWICWSWC